MRIPRVPPDQNEILSSLFEGGSFDRIQALIEGVPFVNTNDDYLHWEKVRFKDTPSDFSKEEFWFIIKQARKATMRYLPFEPVNAQEHKLYFTRPDCLLSALRRLDIQTGGSIVVPEVQISREDANSYLQKSFLEEPFNSSVLEGAITTRDRARELIDTGENPNTLSDKMVVNNYYAMAFVKDNLTEDLTPERIMEVQKIITEDTLERPEMAGVLRDNNDIVVGDDFGNVFHNPPDFVELSQRLQAICDFANSQDDKTQPYVHPLVKAIILHFMISYDHPFVDGNGRTARALFYWFALRSGYWMIEYTSISSVINEAKTQYGSAFLYTETDENDLTYFIMHQLTVLEKSIFRLQTYIERQRQSYFQLENSLEDALLNYRQKHLLTEMIKGVREYTEISTQQANYGKSYLTSRKDLEDLVNSSWLRKEKIGRNSFYRKGRKIKALSK